MQTPPAAYLPRRPSVCSFTCGAENQKNQKHHKDVSGFFGDPYGNRTHVPAVKGRCLDRLTNGPLIKYSESLAKPHTAYYCKHASQYSLSFDVVAVVGFEPTTNRV